SRSSPSRPIPLSLHDALPISGSGAVAWQFEPRGLITIPRSGSVDADEVALTAIDAGAEDVDTDADEAIEIYTEPGALESVRKARSEEHTSELQSRVDLVCRLL